MYESPVILIPSPPKTTFDRQGDSVVMKTIHQLGVKVDKTELLKALNYDRQQYDKGYRDGFEDSVKRLAELLREQTELESPCLFTVSTDHIDAIIKELIGDEK